MKYKIKEINVDAGEFTVILNAKDAKEMGVRSLERVKLIAPKKTITAIVEISTSLVKEGEVGMLLKVTEALKETGAKTVGIMPTERPYSVELIKKKIDNHVLTGEEIREIIQDIANHNLTDIELTAFVVANQLVGMNLEETMHMTKAMVETGDTIELDKSPVFDFHSIGGAPGNKITLLVVPIVAAAGLYIPKTSSRAISSACGTADIFETIARVGLSMDEIKSITEEIGGVIAWGGNVNFAPADDMIIRVEYPLSLDPYAQLIASVMAKKKAVGSDFFLLDIPIGPGTKVTEHELANKYAQDFIEIGRRLDMHVECAITYGGQPIGKHIGPSLEAKEAMMCLEGKAPSTSVVEKSVAMAGILLEMGGIHNGKTVAREILDSGKALAKMRQILQAQDGNPDLKSDDIMPGKFKAEICSNQDGYVTSLNNKKLVRIARAAGSPKDIGAGLVFLKKRGEKLDKGEPMYVIYADNKNKLEVAVNLSNMTKPYTVEGMIIAHIPGSGRISGYSK
ncbi:MAG: AMP phosphorylase [Candidatus Thermoplasmatota archaeon]|nr:AMP phosphorylase [Euryarchaeota archaeon]MBU4031356.1 AMP phosphorylase [Candidatus Thermoplasmatota archaeon]MBU4070837.1 AMP phosphorylase [Candidatus Thermoplasmatota archaeon]MBU4143520.1 AMP phosphorylase [Candidatus Thermoplasmatota archaeon]MBU4591968.1 AMP phosphorylase [Candidatus Thermoplasmatota archaeon]